MNWIEVTILEGTLHDYSADGREGDSNVKVAACSNWAARLQNYVDSKYFQMFRIKGMR